MNSKVTLGFLVAVLALAALVVGLERSNVGQPPAKDASEEEIVVFAFDDRKVTAFTARLGDQTVRVERGAEGEWKLAETGEAANRASINSLVIRLGNLKGTKRVAEAGADLKPFGLAEPSKEATVELEDGTKHALLLGDKTPIGTGVYARKPDADEIVVVASQLSDDLERLVRSPKEPPTPTPRPEATPTAVGPVPLATPTPAP